MLLEVEFISGNEGERVKGFVDLSQIDALKYVEHQDYKDGKYTITDCVWFSLRSDYGDKFVRSFEFDRAWERQVKLSKEKRVFVYDPDRGVVGAEV